MNLTGERQCIQEHLFTVLTARSNGEFQLASIADEHLALKLEVK
jgi:hypothetical protein